MSSLLRAPAQIPVRTKFLVGLSDLAAGADAFASPAFTVDAGKSVQDVMTATALDTAATGAAIANGRVYRDLGRQVTVHDAARRRVAVYRCVQEQLNVATEGVQNGTDLYVRVWAADGTNIGVARLG